MDKLKLQLERRLIANLLIDKCKLHENAVIDEAWCTQDRVMKKALENVVFPMLFWSE